MKYKLIIDKNAEEEIIAVVHAPSAITKEIEDLVYGFSGTDSIIGYSNDEIRKLAISEIECITVIDRKVVAIYTDKMQYLLKDRLKDLESILPSYFIRINKSSIANEHKILRFKTVFSGGIDAVFKCGYKEYVSRRCFAEIKRRLEKI